MYSLLLALIYLAFISLGLPDSLLGSGWPVMHAELGVPVSYMGVVTMVISGGTIASSLLSDKLTRKLGTGGVTAASVLLTVLGLFGFSVSTKFWMLLAFAVPYGLGAGAIDAALNNYVALHYKARHMSWLHCFWGVGTIVSPFVMSWALTHRTWNDGYRAVALVQLCIAALLLVTLPVWKKAGGTAPEEKRRSVGVRGALKIKGVPYLLAGFFGYCAAETTAMQWASTYFVAVKGLPTEDAAGLAALFYIGITAGRFVSGFAADRLGDRKMIRLGTGVLFCGIAALALPMHSHTAAIAAFVVMGLGCAPIYPCIIHSTPEGESRVNTQNSLKILVISDIIRTNGTGNGGVGCDIPYCRLRRRSGAGRAASVNCGSMGGKVRRHMPHGLLPERGGAPVCLRGRRGL